MRTIVLSVAFLAIFGLVLAQDQSLNEDELDLDEISRGLEADDTEENKDEDLFIEDDTDETKRADAKIAVPVPRRCSKPRNCRDLKNNGERLSGIYRIFVYYRSGAILREKGIDVYCEMAIANGPYTFLPRDAILRYPTLQLNYIVTNRKKVLLRFQDTDTTQPYTKIEQLNVYANRNLGIKINSFAGYTSPLNVNNMHKTYLFLGFLPKTAANNHNIHGFKSNNQQLTFKNCDKNPNSYFAFFPNHFEGTPSSYGSNGNMYKLTNNWLKSSRQPFSHRTMPNQFFFFTEHHFGGCGAYWQSNHRYTKATGGKLYRSQVEGVAVGFA